LDRQTHLRPWCIKITVHDQERVVGVPLIVGEERNKGSRDKALRDLDPQLDGEVAVAQSEKDVAASEVRA
jgi:hypothetical protein